MTASSPWTAERVLALAPDAASAQAGRGQTAPSRWPTLGQRDGLLWGECRGSGSKPYQTKVDLADVATSCSCPSRKFPCKHALGLLLLWADRPDLVAASDPPPWVAAWVEARARRAEAKSSPAGPATATTAALLADPAGKQKREAARLAKVVAGLDDLDLWLGDLVRAGFATLASRPANLWDEQARRLVDAQCPGVARRLRQLIGISRAGEGWQAALLDRLAELHLLIAGFRRRDALPPPVLADLRAAIGFPADLDAVRSGTEGEQVRDTWEVLGHAFALEDKLTVRRTWLRGRASGRSALVLDFAAPGRSFEVDFEPGTVAAASLGFFPGAAPLRALVIDRDGLAVPVGALDGGTSIAAAQAGFGAHLARNPWVELVSVVLASITLDHDDGTWSAIDPTGAGLPLARSFERGWHVEALSGGGPIVLAGEFDGTIVNPLGALVAGQYVNLTPPGTPARPDPAIGSPGRRAVPQWAPLVAAAASATVGVDRKAPPTLPSSDPLGAVVAAVSDRTAPARLLATAAVLGLAARAGRRPRVGPPPPASSLPPEDRPECPPAAAARLRALMGGPDGDLSRLDPGHRLVLEWVATCDRTGARLPADLLVPVLGWCCEWPGRQSQVAAILGRRGAWLAAQNPTWARYGPVLDPAAAAGVWETGTKPERLALFRSLRETAPAEARRLAASTFVVDPASFRAAVVDHFETNLGPDDEPFLEAALDDRGQEVRSSAARRLQYLPDSRLSRRMAERAATLLAWDGERDRLEVMLPPEADKALLRDGMTSVVNGWIDGQKIGERSWGLHQVLALAPTAAIGDQLGQPPEAIVRAASKTEYAMILRDAWEVAAIRHRDPAWCLALARARVKLNHLGDPSRLAALLAELDPADRVDLIAGRLARSPTTLPAADPALKLILAAEGPLGVDLGREILGRLRGVLLAERLEVAAGVAQFHTPANVAYRTLLQGLDRKLPWELIDEAAALLATPPDAALLGHAMSLHASLDAMLDRWKFRRDLHREFALP